MEWDNEDPVKETVEFVCHAVTIHYLPQLPDGTLGAAKQARRPLRLPLGRRQPYLRLRSGHFQQLTRDHTAIVVEYAPAEEDETLLSRA